MKQSLSSMKVKTKQNYERTANHHLDTRGRRTVEIQYGSLLGKTKIQGNKSKTFLKNLIRTGKKLCNFYLSQLLYLCLLVFDYMQVMFNL